MSTTASVTNTGNGRCLASFIARSSPSDSAHTLRILSPPGSLVNHIPSRAPVSRVSATRRAPPPGSKAAGNCILLEKQKSMLHKYLTTLRSPWTESSGRRTPRLGRYDAAGFRVGIRHYTCTETPIDIPISFRNPQDDAGVVLQGFKKHF